MYKHILVATDGSKLSLRAVKAAAALASCADARLSALYVMPQYSQPTYGEGAAFGLAISPKRFRENAEMEAAEAMVGVAKAADAAEISCSALKSTDPQPWNAIIQTARKRKCDLIVMASHGRRGLSGFLLGSETQKVLTHTKVPVLVVR